jgi:hypothetical protein
MKDEAVFSYPVATALHFVARSDGSPFLEPGPEPLDLVAVVVDPLWTSHGCLVALGRDRRPRTHPPDALPEDMACVASITKRPTSAQWPGVRARGRHGGVRAPDRVRSEKAIARPAASAITQALVP